MPPRFAFNGDFNWFNIAPGRFRAINESVLEHHALRGNVETEIASKDAGAGCGCAVPDYVGAAQVEHSKQIIERLRRTAQEAAHITPAAAGASLYGSRIDGVFIDALRLDYDPARWLGDFLADWPPGSPGSPAHASYFRRIVSGPAYAPGQARVQQTTGDAK